MSSLHSPLPRRRGLAVAAVGLGASLLLWTATPAAAAQPPVGLATATSFAVLAGSGITNTGPTTITGDVGTFPTPTITGFDSVTLIGTNHAGDAVTQGAKQDLQTAYNDAAGRSPVTNVPTELGGSTLLAGVYSSPTLGLTGTLTLDAQGDPFAQFIFKAGSTLITEANSRVRLVNGADPCRVVWQVGSSATFKTGTRFVGDVLSHTSITAQSTATFQGRLLALGGAVTLDTNTITNAACAAAGGAPTTSTSTTSTSTTSTSTTSTTATTATTSGTPTTPAPGGATAGGAGAGAPAASPVAAPRSTGARGTAGPGLSTGGSRTPTAGVGGPSRGGPGSGSPGLPATGASTGLVASAGLALLAGGVVVLARARREGCG